MSQTNDTKNVRIQSRVDTSENWAIKNPILLKREIGYETNGRYKIGDGIIKEDGSITGTAWNDLPYAIASDLELGKDNITNFSLNTFATGANNVAGGKAFKIVSEPSGTDGDIGTYTLDSVKGIEVGMTYSVVTSIAVYHQGTIQSVNNSTNTVTVNNFKGYSLNKNKDDPAKFNIYNTFIIDGHPELGTTEIGFNAQAFGQDNIAHNVASYAEGKNNMALGKFSHAEGLGNIAGHAAHAEGSDTEALGAVSHTEGQTTIASGTYSHAEGWITRANAKSSHAEGELTTANGESSHTEGYNTLTQGKGAHAEGYSTLAQGTGAHAEGYNTATSGDGTHAEGYDTVANGTGSHAEGQETKAGSEASHAEGYNTAAYGIGSHTEGQDTYTDGSSAHAEGNHARALGDASHSEGINTLAYESYSHAEGGYTEAYGAYSHTEGHGTKSYQESSHAEGINSKANGVGAHGEGYHTIANGDGSHTEGYYTETVHYKGGQGEDVSSSGAHAEGYYTKATKKGAHAEGYGKETDKVIADGSGAHAEGCYTKAVGDGTHTEGFYTEVTYYKGGSGENVSSNGAHAEGYYTTASRKGAHAEGYGELGSRGLVKADGFGAHAEGCFTQATNDGAHAEGYLTRTSGRAAHAEGYGTTATVEAQHVQGKYNYNGNYAHIIGGGTSDVDRRNIHTVDWQGNAWFQGNIYVGGTFQDDPNAINLVDKIANINIFNGKDSGLVPSGSNNDANLYLAGDGVWRNVFDLTVNSWDKTFEQSTWEEVVYVCQNKLLTNWAIGDTKTMTLTEDDGTTTDYNIVIIGTNHDIYDADTTEYAPYTFQFVECYPISYESSPYAIDSSNTTSIWPNSAAEASLQSILSKMPGICQSNIKKIKKSTVGGKYNPGTLSSNANRWYNGVSSSPVNLFLLSHTEILGTGISCIPRLNNSTIITDGTQYSYYAAGNSKIKTLKTTNEAVAWLSRTSKVAGSPTNYRVFISSQGAATITSSVTKAAYLAPAFCF